jgi:Protein of unknown function (DUF732)
MIDGLTTKLTVCAFGAVLAVMLGPAAVGRADAKDDEFTNFLATHGINLGTSSHTADIAREMCQQMEDGYTQGEEEQELEGGAISKLSPDQAVFFVGAATAAYCPKKVSKPAGG